MQGADRSQFVPHYVMTFQWDAGKKPILVPLLGYQGIHRQANPKLVLH